MNTTTMVTTQDITIYSHINGTVVVRATQNNTDKIPTLTILKGVSLSGGKKHVLRVTGVSTDARDAFASICVHASAQSCACVQTCPYLAWRGC